MSNAQAEQAEQVEPMTELDQKIQEAISETNEESAPQLEEVPEVEKPEELAEETPKEVKPKDGGFQKRINKVTADKWEQQRRADALQEELNQLKSTQQTANIQTSEPKLEDYDYDEQAFNSALIDYKVELKANEIAAKQQESSKQQDQANIAKEFESKSAEFAEGKDDFIEVLGKVPVLQPTVLNAVMSESNGPELAYFLGKHLDIADKIASMNPIAAAVEIGKLSMKLSEPKQIKPSSAPEPIDGVSSGGAVESSIDDEMSISDWMKTYNK